MLKKLMKRAKWWLNHPWEIPIAIDLRLIEVYPTPYWRRQLSNALSPLTKIAVRRWHPETFESPPGWSPRPWNKRQWK